MELRVCHVNLARGYRGGERQTELLIRELSRLGISQRAIVRGGDELASRIADVPGLDLRAIGKPFLASVGLGRGFLLHAHESKAAHFAHWSHLWTQAPYLITRRVNLPPSSSWLTRLMYRGAGAVVAVAGAVSNGLCAYEPSLEPVVIHSAMSQLRSDPDTSRALRERWAGKFVVSHAGALVNSQKGQTYLIRAARRLAGTHPDIHFVLMGDGPDEARFRSEAAGLQNLSFEGFVKNVGDYLAASDIFVLPSLHEGIGGVLLDAMSFGLPVVASAVDGLPEIVRDGGNGLLIPPADDRRLAEAIAQLHDDPALRQRLGATGRQVAADYTPAVMADRYIAVYGNLQARCRKE